MLNLLRLRAPGLLVSVATLALGCSSSPPSPARGSVNVTVRSLLATPIASLQLTVQSSSMLADPRKIPLIAKGDDSSAIINNLLVAKDYLITAEASDSNHAVVAHGLASAVAISKGQTTKVIIYLNQVTESPPFSNSSPLIDAITLSADAVWPGGEVGLTATAHDPDVGQTATLSFTWVAAARCGTIAGVSKVPGTDGNNPSRSQADWIAPQSAGNCQVTLTVTDVLGLATSATFSVGVNVGPNGSAAVTVVFNGAPSIQAVTAAPAQLSFDGPTSGALAVIVADPEDDSLNYLWSADPNSPCAVEFATPTEVSTAFTATATQTGATSCTFVVAVSDGLWPHTHFKKSTSTADLTLAMTAPLLARTPPLFGIAYQSGDTATGGAVMMFAAIAFDPEEGTLSFDWSASSGSAPVPTRPTLLGLDTAFSTAATWEVPDGAENMTYDLLVNVTATSSVSTLSSTSTFSLKPASLQQ